ncbi:hypothetical protein FOA52_003130 [Chlamydomonas sp. UWO 241]|nr:hypothetical protein FOA52_003130 [Chlamydomonas sp. UWO 241]
MAATAEEKGEATTSIRSLRCAPLTPRWGASSSFGGWTAPEEETVQYNKALGIAFQAASAALAEEHKALAAQEQENTRVVNSRGDLPADMASDYERARKAYEGLHRAVVALAEALDKPMPQLAEDAFTRLEALDKPMPQLAEDAFTRLGAAESAGATQSQQQGDGGADANEHVFEDVESRVFYESLPDIRSMVPGVLLGVGADEKDAKEEPKSSDGKRTDGTDDAGGRADDGDTPDGVCASFIFLLGWGLVSIGSHLTGAHW